jgi:membrane associated rhomboid family serine protease
MFPLRDNIPLARFPIVTAALVAINVVAYLLAIRHGGNLFGRPTASVAVHYGAVPRAFTNSAGMPPAHPPTWETAFTSMFLQGSFLAILANMLFLVLFGPTVEDTVGRRRFAGFYLLGGLVALGTHVLLSPNSTNPTLGAAGAISAVLGGYVLLQPRARILSIVPIPFLVTIVAVPALALIAFWFAIQLALSLTGLTSPVDGGDGAAYLALIGGFLFGLLAIRPFARAGRGPAGKPSTGSEP